jgi:hypothetical protein
MGLKKGFHRRVAERRREKLNAERGIWNTNYAKDTKEI